MHPPIDFRAAYGDWSISDGLRVSISQIPTNRAICERLSMIIGDDFKRLEQRVTAALCGESLISKEALFLQNILRKIELYRNRAFISDSQASWLFAIITRFEQGTTNNVRHDKPISAPSRHSSSDDISKRSIRTLAGLDDIVWSEEKKPEAFDLRQAMEPDRSS